MIADILRSVHCLNRIRAKERASLETLSAYQFERMKSLVGHAYERVPYYRHAYGKAGLHPSMIRSWDDFRRLPMLTKQDRRSNPADDFLVSGTDKARVWTSQTTGSSGIPITVWRDAESAAWDRALMNYGFGKLGIRPYHRFCQISAILSEKPARPGPFAKLGFKRTHIVSLRQPDEIILREMEALKPDVVYTFPSVLLRLSEALKRGKASVSPRWLIAQGEVLPDSWRSTIEEAFGAPLYHTYGATEIARIGFECRWHQGYHLIPDAAVVEVLKDGRPAAPDEEGDLVITGLNSRLSPFIRYQIGDRGILSRAVCPCGLTLPLLKNVVGRSDDFLVLPSGRKVSARAVTHMRFDGILQYKIVQKSPAHLQVLVIPSETFGENTAAEIRKVLDGAFFGEPLEIEILKTESLPVSRTGKLQLVMREF